MTFLGKVHMRCQCGEAITIEVSDWETLPHLERIAHAAAEEGAGWKDGKCAECARHDDLARRHGTPLAVFRDE